MQQEKAAGEIVKDALTTLLIGIDVDLKKREMRQGFSTPAAKVPKAVPFLP